MKNVTKIVFGIMLAGAVSACGTSGPTVREQRVAAALDNRGQALQDRGQYLQDQGITSRVAARFTAEPRYRDAEVHVATVDNVVTLTGFVRNGSDIGFAEDLALSVDGVRGVSNRLVVN